MHALGDKADRYSLPRPVQGALGKLRQRKYSLMAFQSSWTRASEAKTKSDPLGCLEAWDSQAERGGVQGDSCSDFREQT